MDFKDLTEALQAEAIANKLLSNEETVWRFICRAYSEKFHTPLHVVSTELDPAFVIQHHYEGQLDDVDVDESINEILDTIYTLEDPEYAREKEEEIQRFIQDTEHEEKERLDKGIPLFQWLLSKQKKDNPTNSLIKKAIPDKEPEIKKELPKGGSINLSYLEAEEDGTGVKDED